MTFCPVRVPQLQKLSLSISWGGGAISSSECCFPEILIVEEMDQSTSLKWKNPESPSLSENIEECPSSVNPGGAKLAEEKKNEATMRGVKVDESLRTSNQTRARGKLPCSVKIHGVAESFVT